MYFNKEMRGNIVDSRRSKEAEGEGAEKLYNITTQRYTQTSHVARPIPDIDFTAEMEEID